MPISPSSSVQRAREQLAERLRDIRLDARLTARALSAAAGWHEAKTSRIESAKKAPSEDDIRTWCRVCGAERAIPDLIAASRSADSMYTEWRRLQPAGMRRDQENRLPLHERTKVLKAYVGTVVPGFLQTPEYATALLSPSGTFTGLPTTWPMPWPPGCSASASCSRAATAMPPSSKRPCCGRSSATRGLCLPRLGCLDSQ